MVRKSAPKFHARQLTPFFSNHRLNPPLPVDYDGNWYNADKEEDPDDGLTPEERAILADLQ